MVAAGRAPAAPQWAAAGAKAESPRSRPAGSRARPRRAAGPTGFSAGRGGRALPRRPPLVRRSGRRRQREPQGPRAGPAKVAAVRRRQEAGLLVP
eukprot:10780242-Lingulodinium_polyedra.AAC.1